MNTPNLDSILMRELAVRYLLPALGVPPSMDARLKADLLSCCRLVKVHRNELLQCPGDWRHGYLYWFEWASAHTYYEDALEGRQPVELLLPDRFFLEAESVLYREERYAHLQALEDGLALRISYRSLRALMRKHPAFRGMLERLANVQDAMQRKSEAYRHLPLPERIDRFLARFGAVAYRLTLDVQALHMRVDADTFREYMRRNRRPYTSLRLHKIAMNAPVGAYDDT